MTPRVLPIAVFVVLVVAALAVVLRPDGSDAPRSAAPAAEQRRAALEGAPAPLAKLHRQGSRLLGGGPPAFEARLAELKGYPVVVNKWGSWCEPCRAEFPYFQRLAVERGREVAFLGVDGNDNESDAKQFLRQFPVAFPSYIDDDLKIAAKIKAVAAFPSTVFYDREGEIVKVKQGAYLGADQLRDDIERYAR